MLKSMDIDEKDMRIIKTLYWKQQAAILKWREN